MFKEDFDDNTLNLESSSSESSNDSDERASSSSYSDSCVQSPWWKITQSKFILTPREKPIYKYAAKRPATIGLSHVKIFPDMSRILMFKSSSGRNVKMC